MQAQLYIWWLCGVIYLFIRYCIYALLKWWYCSNEDVNIFVSDVKPVDSTEWHALNWLWKWTWRMYILFLKNVVGCRSWRIICEQFVVLTYFSRTHHETEQQIAVSLGSVLTKEVTSKISEMLPSWEVCDFMYIFNGSFKADENRPKSRSYFYICI